MLETTEKTYLPHLYALLNPRRGRRLTSAYFEIPEYASPKNNVLITNNPTAIHNP
jgi:hypothetical protein